MQAKEHAARFAASSENRLCHSEGTNFQMVVFAKNLMNKFP
jgi:hypothetical protein